MRIKEEKKKFANVDNPTGVYNIEWPSKDKNYHFTGKSSIAYNSTISSTAGVATVELN